MARFIGREEELHAIAAVAGALLRSGSGPVAVTVTGEAGVGKSRLLAEAAAAAVPAGVRVVRVTGYEPERYVPLASAQLLLEGLLPPSTPRPVDRLALFEAVLASFRAQAHDLLLVVDDLQWVDEQSLGLVHYLARGAAAERTPIGLVLATRPAPGSVSFLRSLDRVLDGSLGSIDLKPLDSRDAADLARQLGAGAEAHDISRRAGGSPFWIEVLAREVAAGGAAPGDGRRLVADRLAGAGGDALELLALLAVAGRPIAVADAARVLDWPADRVDHALAELVNAGVARAGLPGASVVHDLVREAVDRGLREQTRIRLRRALARHLEGAAGADSRLLWEALGHRIAAGDHVADLALRIATSPNRRLLGTSAVSTLAGIAASDGGGGLGRGDGGLDLARAVARLASELAAHDQAIALWHRVAEQSPEPDDRADAALAGCRHAIALGDRARGRELLAAAFQTIDPDRDRRRAVIADALEAGVVRWLEGDLPRAHEPARRALARARDLAARTDPLGHDERAAYLEALQAASDTAMAGMLRAEMLALAHEMRGVAAESAEPAVRLQSWWQSGVAEYMNGRLADAEASLRHVWDEAGRLALPGIRAEAGYWLGYTIVDRGRASEARTVLRETAALLDRTGGNLKFNNRVALPLGISEILAGDWRDGIRILASDAAALTDPHPRLRVTAELAKWRARLDGPAAADEVRGIVEATLADARAAACRRCTQEAEVVCADAAAIVANVDQAVAGVARWEELRPDEANFFERLHALRARALVDRGPDAVESLRAGIRAPEATDQRLEVAWSLVTLADVSRERDPATARAALRSAAALAREAGMVTIERIARQRARALGVRTWRRTSPASRSGSLSSRELEVAEHIAAGESNVQIAAALFLSRRTIDRHVENILRKLSVPNRAAAVAAIRMGSPADDLEDVGSLTSR